VAFDVPVPIDDLFAVLKIDLLKIGRYVDSQTIEVEKQN
jgi:hypothetical protein